MKSLFRLRTIISTINCILYVILILKYSIVDHFILCTDDRVDLLARYHRIHISLVTDHIVRSQGRVVALHDDPYSRHHVTTRALLRLVRRRGVADLGVDLLGLTAAGLDQLRERR